MDWNTIWQLIDPKLIIVVAACWIIGFMLKKTPKVPDWTIVYIVTITAVVFTIWLTQYGPEAIIQGILSGAFAVYGNQVLKQTKKTGERIEQK